MPGEGRRGCGLLLASLDAGYGYANSLAMVLGAMGPEPAVIEVLTSSPFGAELIGGVTPFFDPLGWEPGIGLDAAIDLLGWTCRHGAAGSDADATAWLREANAGRPLLAGPLEFGLLLHHPGSGTAHRIRPLHGGHGCGERPRALPRPPRSPPRDLAGGRFHCRLAG